MQSDPALFDDAAFERELAGAASPLQVFKRALRHATEVLEQRFNAGHRIGKLVTGRAWVIDQILGRAWQRIFGPEEHRAALIAVGGYGRGELHPHSDIDLMLLLDGEVHEALREPIEQFLMFLWDIGLEVGHSVRTLEQCLREAEQDITVATNLMESRLLQGPARLHEQMREATGPARVWPSRDFFEAKWREQIARHRKFHDTAYNLEPNIKESPGGLRDIQVIGWVAKRHFGVETLAELVERGFLTEKEYKTLISGQNFLWRVRFGLHVIAKRREDRLLFDHQRALAERFGYRDRGPRLPVEQFMKRYYRTVMELGRLNEMLLQLFQEEILYAHEPHEAVPINRRFQAHKGFIEVVDDKVFERTPFALLEVFLLLAQHPELKGVRAGTIRLLRIHRERIDAKFRNDISCRSLFMEILRQPRGVTHELRRMNRYGILAAYLPTFARIVGQMQHDLFHVYTVDEHTLFVVRNLRRLTVPRFHHEFPFCSELMAQLPKPEILYIAALFHDIAKGRGGDHSELGGEDVVDFCRHHFLSEHDTRLAEWLVRNHLLMSSTAQRQDISDADVINAFAARVGTLERLKYLYLLTVADIRATSPNLWNSWKDALLAELYHAAEPVLDRGLDKPVAEQELREGTEKEALALLAERGIEAETVAAIWNRFGSDYFLRYSADEVAWHTAEIIAHGSNPQPLILVRQDSQRGGTELFIYTRQREGLFAINTRTMEQLCLNIVEARITGSKDGFTLDSYIVLEENGNPIDNPLRTGELTETLRAALTGEELPTGQVCRHLARRLKQFLIATEVSFEDDVLKGRTVMKVVSSDRPGLLSRVARAMRECGVRLLNAKITTLGERVEDIFFVNDGDSRPLMDQKDCLRERITAYLSEEG